MSRCMNGRQIRRRYYGIDCESCVAALVALDVGALSAGSAGMDGGHPPRCLESALPT